MMSKATNTRRQLEDLSGWMEEFQAETDRGAALIGGAFLDEQLKELLQGFLVDDTKRAEEMLGAMGPLGTFSSRILASYLLGLITSECYEDLQLVRKIRNHFAHKLQGTTFADQQVVGWCSTLRQCDRLEFDSPLTPRDRFVITVIQLNTWIKLKASSVNKGRRKSPPEPKYARFKGNKPVQDDPAL